MKKEVFVVFAFVVLALLQVSFLPPLSLGGFVLNLVLFALLPLALFASLKIGVEAALAGGFFLDVYSTLPFGFWMVLSLVTFLVVRHIFKNYVRPPQYI